MFLNKIKIMSSEKESKEKVDTKLKAYNLIHDPTLLLDLIYSKYGDIEEDFNLLYINQLVYDKSSHFNIYYKEYLFYNDPEEYLKRFYKRNETKSRIPKLSDYYKNYHLFFCRPNFKDLVISDLMENYGDDKAEIFYKKNFESTNDDKDSEMKNSDSMSSLDNITDNKIIFTKKTKKIIDKNLDPNYGTLTLTNNSNLTGKNEDGLISARSKNDSFEKIVHNLIYYKKNRKIYERDKNKKVYQVKKNKNRNTNININNNKKINKNNNNNSTNDSNKVEQNKKKINKNMIHNLDINNGNNMTNTNKSNNNGKNIRNKNSLFSLLKSNNLINYAKTDNNILNNNINKHHNNFTVTINLSKPQNITTKSQKNKTSISNSNNILFSSPKISKEHLTTKYEEFHSNIKVKNAPFSHKRNKTEYFNPNNLGSLTNNNTQGNNNNDINNKKIKNNNYISKILTKKVNSRNYQENLKNLNLNYRPNTKFNHFFTISNNNLMNKQKINGGGVIKNKTFEVDNVNNNDIIINQINNLKDNLQIYKKNKISHRPNNSNSNNKYINNKIVIKKNYISGSLGSKFNLVKSPGKLNNNNGNSNNNINNKKYNGSKKLNNEMNIKISSINNFNKNAVSSKYKISNHKKSQSNVFSNFLETSSKNQIYSPVTSTKQFNNKLYDINKSENIVTKMRPKIENNKINNLNINFNNVIFNAPLSNINDNINFNNNFINNTNFNENYKLLTPTNNHNNNFNNTFSNNNNNFINSMSNNNKLSKTNANLNAHFIKNNISNNSNNNTKPFNNGLSSEKVNYITNLKNFCNFSRNKMSSLDKYINNTEDIYSLIKNTSDVNPTKLINNTYTNLSKEKNNNEIFKKKKRELIIPKQNAKKISIKSANKKDIQIKKPKKKIEGRNKKFECDFGNYGATQNIYFSRNLGILGHLELIKNINESFKTRDDNKKNYYNSTNYLCSSPNNTGRISGIKPINVNRNSNLINKKYLKAKPNIKGK